MKVNIPIGNQPPISESKGGAHGSGSPDGEMRNKLKSVGAVVVCLAQVVKSYCVPLLGFLAERLRVGIIG